MMKKTRLPERLLGRSSALRVWMLSQLVACVVCTRAVISAAMAGTTPVAVLLATGVLLASCSAEEQTASQVIPPIAPGDGSSAVPSAAALPHAIGTDIGSLQRQAASQEQPPQKQTAAAGLAGDFEASADSGQDRQDESIWGAAQEQDADLDAEAPLLSDVAADNMPPPRRRSDAEMAASSEQNPVEITWDQLVPADYSSEEALAKYQGQIAALSDSDPAAEALYQKILAEINNAPADKAVHGKWIRLPGFIAPLTQDGEEITEFLLVPYFGACIHAPPPPINQTVLVQTAKDNGIAVDDAYYPVWVMGQVAVESHPTDIGAAGYAVKNARIERYDEL